MSTWYDYSLTEAFIDGSTTLAAGSIVKSMKTPQQFAARAAANFVVEVAVDPADPVRYEVPAVILQAA